MKQISKMQAVEIAVKHGKDLKLADFVVDGVYHSEDEGFRPTANERLLLNEDERALLAEDERQPHWNVILGFVDTSEEWLDHLWSVTVHVDASTGRPWIVKSL